MRLRRSWNFQPGLALAAPALQLPLLLVFFLLPASSVLLQPGIAVTVPESPFVLSPQRDPVVVSVGPPPASAIYFEGREAGLSGLREGLARMRGQARSVIVRADARALHERVSAVLTVAVELGFPVVLATSERRDSP